MNAKNFILGTTLVVFGFESLISKTRVSLKQAFDKKMITAKSICAGGLALNYSVTNLLKDSLIVIIPAGWRFNSDAGKMDYQDILVTKDQILVLNAHQTKIFDIKGFCCEATKGGPQKGAKYTLGKLADSNLVSLARYLKANPIDENSQQYSVWAISDKKETSSITNNNDSLASLLRTFVSKIKGEPIPWYTLLKKATITQSGAVYDIPLRFKANINYVVPKTCYSYCYIIDSNGNKVSEIFGQWLQPEKTEYFANFNVIGLQKGKYKLVLKNENNSLFEKSFDI
jgi:hypothetical protein